MFSLDCQADSKIETFSAFRTLLKRYRYSKKAIEEIWKWYDPSERKGTANF
jgi:hypothetical protein